MKESPWSSCTTHTSKASLNTAAYRDENLPYIPGIPGLGASFWSFLYLVQIRGENNLPPPKVSEHGHIVKFSRYRDAKWRQLVKLNSQSCQVFAIISWPFIHITSQCSGFLLYKGVDRGRVGTWSLCAQAIRADIACTLIRAYVRWRRAAAGGVASNQTLQFVSNCQRGMLTMSRLCHPYFLALFAWNKRHSGKNML